MADTNATAGRLGPLLDRAVTIPSARIHHYVDEVRRANPGASPAEVIAALEQRLLLRSSIGGGGVGMVASVPAVGTGTAILLTGVQVVAFLRDAAMHVMAVADVHGVPIDDVERRRALLLVSLMGEEGAAMQSQLGVGSLYWGRTLLTRVPIGTVRAMSRQIRSRALGKGAAVGGRVFIGRLLPFGIGAFIGYRGGRMMAKDVITGVRDAFEPPPPAFTREVGQVPRLATMEVQ
jgi:hypothetical protein